MRISCSIPLPRSLVAANFPVTVRAADWLSTCKIAGGWVAEGMETRRLRTFTRLLRLHPGYDLNDRFTFDESLRERSRS